MRVTMFDYGAGNLHSLAKALKIAGATVEIETDPARCVGADALILPGVGAFAHAAERLAPGREVMRAAIRDGLPTLGVCLGMQLLFDESDEGEGKGLGVIPGRVERIDGERVPQIGWNTLEGDVDPLVRTSRLEHVYYANSFVGRPLDSSVVTAWTTHERDRFPAIVRTARAIGVQFHPEKSSSPGIAFLAAALVELGQ
jgi:imidazole glycerol-phosphate synthase subunit HisH